MSAQAFTLTAPLPYRRKLPSFGEAGYKRLPQEAYFSPPWITRSLLAAIELGPADRPRSEVLVWEPACGDGGMAREIEAAGYRVAASDIADYGYGTTGVDFLHDDSQARARAAGAFAIVTNPPFGELAVEFIRRGLALTRPVGGRVLMLNRHEFDAPKGRRSLFDWPFAAKLNLPRRPQWIAQQASGKQTAPRFAFSWFLWDWQWFGEPVLRWLPEPGK